MNIFRKRYDPKIIDLVQYEKDCLYSREQGIPPRPPHSITSREPDWSIAELEAMRDNREKVRAIYDKYRAR